MERVCDTLGVPVADTVTVPLGVAACDGDCVSVAVADVVALVVCDSDGVWDGLCEAVGVNVPLCVFELVSDALGVSVNEGVGDGLGLSVFVADPVGEALRDSL